MTALAPARPTPRADGTQFHRVALLVMLVAACTTGCNAAAGKPAQAEACEARSGPLRATVVELYTSEGCSSCPPADRWLSQLESKLGGEQPLLALAFHVTYWDGLGWVDRFANPSHDQRQRLVVAAQRGRVVYTPQVIVNGADWRGWPRLPKATSASAVDLHLSREGTTFVARVAGGSPGGANAKTLEGYWALLEDGHRTVVRAGENAGAILHHDHVVRGYQPVGPWPAGREQRLRWQVPEIGGDRQNAPSARRVAFVVVDAETQQPLQALALSCR